MANLILKNDTYRHLRGWIADLVSLGVRHYIDRFRRRRGRGDQVR